MVLTRMNKLLLLLGIYCLFSGTATAQNLYFPPITIGATWATTPPQDLGFCPERIDSLYHFLEARDTKSFILLKDGKIVLEKYFGTYTQDSIFYWASAGKSLAAFLVGLAQDEGLLDINDKTSEYLGQGWTSLTPAQEDLITIRHQLTMTTGLDDGVPDDNCLTPACLVFKAAPGTRWAYHNAPYHLTHNVVANASGLTFQQFTRTRLFQKVGMNGFWFNYVMYGRARDMARFGLLMQAKGVWNGDTILHNQTYYNDMINASQTLNKSYGYLWWLNGEPSFMLPATQLVFPGPLLSNAPADMYSALGKDDQKIHIVPSKGWVVVRQGLSASTSLVPIDFDRDLWDYLNALECAPSSSDDFTATATGIKAMPTVSATGWTIDCGAGYTRAVLLNGLGQVIQNFAIPDGTFTFQCGSAALPAGVYHVVVMDEQGRYTRIPVVKTVKN
jgi:CubicO group peptidase (beta-lactamase class C family)